MDNKPQEDFEQFEKRAELAEKQIKELTERLNKIETLSNQSSSSTSVLEDTEKTNYHQKYQYNTLLEEKKRLEKENEALQYRITILLRSLAQEEAKNIQ